ncbi:transcriptional regulator [Gluconacetobacter sacchari]|uniref:transcriptional regulator n=1 Tax=Gluconacetobacter sacchari TaxID=92759 RepID=UPI0039B4E3C6
MPGDSPVRRLAVKGISLRQAFETIGWSVTQAERRSRVHRHRIARWLAGAPADPDFVQWIAALERLHRRLASPLSVHVQPGGNRPLPTAYELTLACLTIGWSERQFAERSCIHRTTLRRLDRHRPVQDWRVGRWVELLADGHRMHPQPETSIENARHVHDQF